MFPTRDAFDPETGPESNPEADLTPRVSGPYVSGPYTAYCPFCKSSFPYHPVIFPGCPEPLCESRSHNR
jgi:hypothetical protein